MTPDWLLELLGTAPQPEGARFQLGHRSFMCRDGILREAQLVSASQAQTADAFGYKWRRTDTFQSQAARTMTRNWLVQRYGDIAVAPWWNDYGDRPLLLDAGCGAGRAAIELFGSRLEVVRYLGVDLSEAVDVAAASFRDSGLEGGFLQADVTALPLATGSVDVIFSEGVLHHTDSTAGTLGSLARLLKPGGRFLFYVYRKKGPVREFTDDYIREDLQDLTPEEAWNALVPLTKLGKVLGDMHVTVDVPEPVDLLGIPAGPIDLQRLVYWHVLKAFHHPDLSVDELNHVNYDWYAPRNAHRQTVEEVRAWCAEAGLSIEREQAEQAGITVVARAGG